MIKWNLIQGCKNFSASSNQSMWCITWTNWRIKTILSSQSVSSIAQSYLTLCNPMDRSTSGLPAHRQLPEFTPTHVHWVGDAIQPSHPVVRFSSCLQSFPASGSFQRSQFFTSGGQSIGVSASTSVLPMNIQDWFPLGWTGRISLLYKGLSKSLLQHHSSKCINSWALSFLYNPTFTSIHDYWKNNSFD